MGLHGAACQLHLRCMAVPAPTRRLATVDPSHVMLVPGGSITYYTKGDFYVAQCDLHTKDKNKCRRTRTASGSASGKGGQGRPIGFLAAFLAHAGCEDGGAEAHYRRAKFLSLDQRRAARREFQRIAGSDVLLSFERARYEGEGSEPDD